jgi:HD-like signal output (HDOD) protein
VRPCLKEDARGAATLHRMDDLEHRARTAATGPGAAAGAGEGAGARLRAALSAFAARGAGERALADRVTRALADGSRVPRLPEAALQAAKVIESPRCDVLDLADTLDAAPEIAARVVEVANGAFFAGSEPIYTARDAIVRMGIRETRNVAIAVVMRTLILDAPGYVPERRALWTRTLATAAWAHGIAAELCGDEGAGFLAGLAHELGRATLFTWLYEEDEETPAVARLAPLADAIGPALGAWILEQWRLPARISAAVLEHAEPTLAPGACATTRALHAARRLARGLTGDAPPSFAGVRPAGVSLAGVSLAVTSRSGVDLAGADLAGVDLADVAVACGLDTARLETLAEQSRGLYEEWLKIL